MQLRLLIWLGAEPEMLAPWLTLALTYLVHSLLWAGAVAVLVRAKGLSSATCHLCWKVALFGPLLSTVLAQAAAGGFERSPDGVLAYVQELAVRPALSSDAGSQALGLLARLGLAAAVLGALRFTGALLHVRNRLRRRRALTDARLLSRVELLRTRMGLGRVVLSESDTLTSPLVIGTREVCLPCAALSALTDAELVAVLAHELAHIERGDGWWFPIAFALQSVLWLNPLNHWVSARFRASAEHAADDRAVQITGHRLALARALVRVAARSAFARQLLMLPAIAHSKCALVRRVRRLTDAPHDVAQRADGRERVSALVAISALAALLSILSVRVAQAQPKPTWSPKSSHATGPNTLADAATQDVREQSERMLELGHRAQSVARLLAMVEQLPAASQDGSPEATRVLELNQELRHIRATQVWLEERLASPAR